MAVTFTDTDIEFYKAALARYAAKEKILIDKWSKALASVDEDINELYSCKPSLERDYRIRAKELVKIDIQIFIDDIKTPCDSFITDFEWSKVK